MIEHNGPPPNLGIGGHRLYHQMATVLDPFAARHHGHPVPHVRTELRRVWREAFAVEMDEPTLTQCAEAIAARRAWQRTLWSTGGERPHPDPAPPSDRQPEGP